MGGRNVLSSGPGNDTLDGGPHFVPESSTVTVRGPALVVTFEEAGLPPNAAPEIEITASTTLVVRCVDPNSPQDVLLESTSSATAADTSTYAADAQGRIVASQTLTATPGQVDISGLDCTTQTTRSDTVTLHDITNGASLTIPGT